MLEIRQANRNIRAVNKASSVVYEVLRMVMIRQMGIHYVLPK